MIGRAHYSVHAGDCGRWYVCHRLAGFEQLMAIDADCPTKAAALAEAACLEEARQRELRRLQAEQRLIDRRAFA